MDSDQVKTGVEVVGTGITLWSFLADRSARQRANEKAEVEHRLKIKADLEAHLGPGREDEAAELIITGLTAIFCHFDRRHMPYETVVLDALETAERIPGVELVERNGLRSVVHFPGGLKLHLKMNRSQRRFNQEVAKRIREFDRKRCPRVSLPASYGLNPFGLGHANISITLDRTGI